MAKIILNDEDIIDIVQLSARQETADISQEDVDSIEEEIVSRMSDEALNWYINHIIPIAGRKSIQEKWNKIRDKNSN